MTWQRLSAALEAKVGLTENDFLSTRRQIRFESKAAGTDVSVYPSGVTYRVLPFTLQIPSFYIYHRLVFAASARCGTCILGLCVGESLLPTFCYYLPFNE